jgi:hypothetical protein
MKSTKTYHIEVKTEKGFVIAMHDEGRGLYKFDDAAYCKKFKEQLLQFHDNDELRVVEETTFVRKSSWGGRLKCSDGAPKSILSTESGYVEITKAVSDHILKIQNENKLLQKKIDKLELEKIDFLHKYKKKN